MIGFLFNPFQLNFMIKKTILLILLMFFISPFYSCNNKKTNNSKITIKNIKYSLFKIKNTYAENTEYRFIDYSKNKNQDILIYNEFSNELEFYNIKQLKITSHLKIDSLITKYGDLNSLNYYNNDTIFLLLENGLLLCDNKGKIKDTYSTEVNYKSKKYFISNTGYYNITYNPKEKKLFLPIYSFDFAFNSKAFFQEPICAIYNLNNRTFQFSNAYYSDLYKTNYFGYASDISHTIDINYLHYFNFPTDDNIYVYDFEKNKLKIINCRSKNKGIESEGIEFSTNSNERAGLDCIITNPLYDNLVYDPFKNLFYRFFYKELKIKNEKGMYNTYDDKNEYLMIFDNELNIITEFLLPKNLFNSSVSIPTPAGLLISSSNYKNINHDKKYFSFYMLTFN